LGCLSSKIGNTVGLILNEHWMLVTLFKLIGIIHLQHLQFLLLEMMLYVIQVEKFIAYCFAEKQGYSKFGSYTGNGSTDGTFVYTGFKPAFVMT
jgi:hypothetical protein